MLPKNLAFSNIAWPVETEADCLQILKKNGVGLLEVAPTKYWPDLLSVTTQMVARKRDELQEANFRIIAAQSLLFGRPELSIFGPTETVNTTIDYLKHVLDICAGLGCRRVVFGSPKNRLRGHRSWEQASNEAGRFFSSVGYEAFTRGMCLCLEANASLYGCDFINTTTEAVRMVQEVNVPGFGLHLDLGNMLLEKESIPDSLRVGLPLAKHFHISAPGMVAIYELGNQIEAVVWESLKTFGECLSVEMLVKDVPARVPEHVQISLDYLSQRLHP